MTIINAVKVKKERKGKGLLYLIAIAILISLVFTACKKRTTAPDTVDVATPITGTSTGVTPTLTWERCSTLVQLFNNGYTYYMSANGDGDTLEIISGNNEVRYRNKKYGLSAGVNKNYTVAQSEGGGAFRFGSENGLSEKFIEFKPSSTAEFKKFTLQKKQ